MAVLVLCAADDKGIKHAELLSKHDSFEKIILVCPSDFSDAIKADIEIKADLSMPLAELSKELSSKLSKHVSGIEVAVSLYSGSGKMHMAVLSALLKTAFGIRLVAISPKGLVEL